MMTVDALTTCTVKHAHIQDKLRNKALFMKTGRGSPTKTTAADIHSAALSSAANNSRS